jgi:transcriptional regulator with XRE-family HTH domain
LTLGERLRRYRERLELSQNQLAKRAGVPQSTISDIEAGKATGVTLETVMKLARALGRTVDELAAGECYDGRCAAGGVVIGVVAPPDGSTD